MDYLKETSKDSVKLILSGRIGNSAGQKFQDLVLESIIQNMKLILDFTNLEYINSTGLRVLLYGMQTAETMNSRLIIKNANQEITELFQITGFAEILEIV